MITATECANPCRTVAFGCCRLRRQANQFVICEGSLSLMDEAWTRGDYPRSFTIDPTGNFLYSCNQRADAIATFRVNKQTGALTFTGKYTHVGTPAIVVFLT